MARRSDRRRQSRAAKLWQAGEVWRTANRCSDLLRVNAELSERKWRLFAVECCRSILPLCVEPWHREAFEQAEQLADIANPGVACTGIAQLSEADNRLRWASGIIRRSGSVRLARTTKSGRSGAIDLCMWCERVSTRDRIHESLIECWHRAPHRRARAVGREVGRAVRGGAARDRGRPVWVGKLRSELANLDRAETRGVIYDSREFSLMPILADALQDADCTDEDLLNHCRDTNAAHVRGCWVVDLVLGKT